MAYDIWVYIGSIEVGDKVHVKEPVKVRMHIMTGLFKKDRLEERMITPSEVLTVTTIPENESIHGGGINSSYYPGFYYLEDKDGVAVWGIPTYLLIKI